ncbi:methyltransferase domain-containing protein [Aliikangiella maris]|uniref:Methyltransferase domain-containing protein n=2 Tax=Aliikangiella maris TaxID=3162458 RepID=A0ABV2BXM9_9GAMM
MAPIKKVDQLILSFVTSDNLPIVDLRPDSEYQKGHIKSSSHFPLENLIERVFQLPANSVGLKLVGNEHELEIGKSILVERGYHIESVLNWRNDYLSILERNNLLSEGATSERLWQPSPAVEHFLSLIKSSDPAIRALFDDLNASKCALDIACGAGRDAVYLAMQGWQVSAVDYLPQMLEKLSALSQFHQVSINSFLLDLEKTADALNKIPGLFDLVLVVRYLHRPLLNAIKQKIKPGGFIVYHTFMQGSEKIGRPKNPRFLLKKGELASQFSDFHIISDEIINLPDGRPTNFFIAKNK